MDKMTKAQARKRLNEALNKIYAVYMSPHRPFTVTTMASIEKQIEKGLKKLD